MERKVSLSTLGCRVNQYESQAVGELLEQYGVTLVSPDDSPSVCFVNTCTVTAESDRKGRQLIRHLRKQNPNAKIVVTGCLAQRDPEGLLAVGADYVSGNRNKLDAARAALRFLDGIAPPWENEVFPIDELPFEEMSITKFSRTRAYLKIEDGCDGKCAYCIIPKVRGGVVSKPRADVVREARTIVEGGCREIVFTGIETSAYGDGLVDLLEELNGIDGLDRIRLGSLDPSFMRSATIDRLKNLEHLMPHFHLSMQAGSDRVLRLMRRRYNRDMALASFAELREKIPHIRFTTDIMTGFPGETDEDFADTLDFARKARFLHIHIFTYSRRPGTEAAEMKDLPEAVKIERASALASLQRTIKSELLDESVKLGGEVLFETYDGDKRLLHGHSENFTEFSVESDCDLRGEIMRVEGVEHDGDVVRGKIVYTTNQVKKIRMECK